jgi:hypothetical protein
VWNYQTKQLDIVLMGNSVPDYKKEEWVTQFKQATGLKDTNIAFFQNTNILAKNGHYIFFLIWQLEAEKHSLWQD